MCRHCERLQEDADFKPIMHAFMERVAKNLNRQMHEEGKRLARPIVADDVSLKVECFVPLESPLQAAVRIMRTMHE